MGRVVLPVYDDPEPYPVFRGRPPFQLPRAQDVVRLLSPGLVVFRVTVRVVREFPVDWLLRPALGFEGPPLERLLHLLFLLVDGVFLFHQQLVQVAVGLPLGRHRREHLPE